MIVGCVGVVLAELLYWLPIPLSGWWWGYAHGVHALLLQSWWAVLMGIVALAVLSQVPRELITAMLGRPGTWSSMWRATAAGLLLDLCNHGILMVAAGLYRRGASLGQTYAFLIASPWNSLSLTLLLSALIGWKWMLIFVLLSALIAVVTGFLVDWLVSRGVVAANPYAVTLGATFSWKTSLKELARNCELSPANLRRMWMAGWRDSAMVMRWLLLGFILTALVRASVSAELMQEWMGPTLKGLGLTIVATTLLEVCSEGSSPLAADLLLRAHAPGNAFAFLMAGAATDYTEVVVLKSTTGRWLSALLMPILVLPQVVLVALLLNQH